MTANSILKYGAIAILALGSGAVMAQDAMDHEMMDHDMMDHELMSHLSGGEEVPGPGDEDATGMFMASFSEDDTQLCYTLEVADLDAPGAAHIHSGAAGADGPPVLMLEAPVPGEAEEVCVDADPDIAAQIKADPASYYVNVHNAAFPGGAIRGQLSAGM